MTPSKNNMLRRIQASFLLILCIGILLSGCTKTQPGVDGTVPTASPPASTEPNLNNTSAQPSPQTESTSPDSMGLPTGVTIKKVVKDVNLNNNYHKKVELLTDGGKRVTITDPNGGVVMMHIEYEGWIIEANGNKVTVQVEQGEQQTITIPSHVVIEDDEQLGLNKGVEIEWELNTNGEIQSVELDD